MTQLQMEAMPEAAVEGSDAIRPFPRPLSGRRDR